MITKDTGIDYFIKQEKWSKIVKSTMKIRDDNNLKEFQILNLRNNLFFNLRSKITKDITEERNELAKCSYCEQKGSSFHTLVLCGKSVKRVWEYVFKIPKNSGYNFRTTPPTSIFFNTVGNPNSFPPLPDNLEH